MGRQPGQNFGLRQQTVPQRDLPALVNRGRQGTRRIASDAILASQRISGQVQTVVSLASQMLRVGASAAHHVY